MRIGFGHSRASTLGVEWELAIVDATTMEQVPGAHLVLDHVADSKEGPLRGEFLDSMIELVTGVHDTVASMTQEMNSLLDQVYTHLAPHGLTVVGVGAHPTGDPTKQQPVPQAQYRRVVDRNGWWGRQMAINGLHIHTGVNSRDKALPMTYGIARFIPYFIALSASSPYWLGADTAFASQRTMIFQQLPTNGLPYHMRSWSEYEKYATELEGVGLIQNPSEIRWDVRPSTFGTVENRAMDSVPTLYEIGALAAFSQCLAEWMSRELDAGRDIERLAYWFMRENKWRAARYGLMAEVITPRPHEHTMQLREGLLRWIADLGPIADQLGCAGELADCATLVRRGPSYLRQRRARAAANDDPSAVIRCLVAEMRSGMPNFEGVR
ncbi:MAG: YbdK family carboxylate-amine ligase [Arachnia sp.]